MFQRRVPRLACSCAATLAMCAAVFPQSPGTGQGPVKDSTAPLVRNQQPLPVSAKRAITLDEAALVFLQQDLEVVVDRYDIHTAEAEELTAPPPFQPPAQARFFYGT